MGCRAILDRKDGGQVGEAEDCVMLPSRGVFSCALRLGIMEYRERIYDAYVTSREIELAPATLAGFAPRAPFLRKLIVDHFPRDRGARILDLGAGHGALLHFAREAGYENVAGIDVSPQQVAA